MVLSGAERESAGGATADHRADGRSGAARSPGSRPAPHPAPAPVPVPVSTPTPGERPAQVLDLRNWNLTLPTGAQGKPDTISQPRLAGYQSDYFRVTDAGTGVAFTTPAGGVTTKNSSYPRSELREMDGAAKASWSNTSGTHTLAVRQAITALPSSKPEIVSAQIHDGSDDVMQVRLEGSRLLVQYDDGRSEITIDPNYRLGTVFDVQIVAADGRVRVLYNGAAKAELERSGSGWYFKSGSYLQSNPSKGDRASVVGTVVIYGLRVTHSG